MDRGSLRLRARALIDDPTRLPRIALALGIFLCPTVFDVRAVKPFDVVKVTVLLAFAAIAAGIWTIELILGRVRPTRTRLGLLAAAFLVAIGISTIFSLTPIVSFFGWYGRYNGFLQFLLFAGVFLLIIQLYWKQPDRLRDLWISMGAASMIVTAYTLVQWRGLDPFIWARIGGGHLFQYASTLGNSNFAGGYMGATFAWLLFAFWRTRLTWLKLAIVGWGAATMFAIFLTASRGGLLAALATIAVGALAIRGWFSRKVVIVGLMGAALLIAGAVALGSRPPSFQGSRANPRDVLRAGTLRTRVWWWTAAARNFVDHPIVGSGPDTFVVVWPSQAPRESAGYADAETADKPHNVLLEHASSHGILGLGTYLVLVVMAFLYAGDRLRTSTRPERPMLASFTAFLGAYLAQALFSIDVTALALSGWVALGGMAVLADPKVVATRERDADVPVPRPARLNVRRGVAIALVVALAAFVIISGMRPWRADRFAKIPPGLQAREGTGSVLRRYESAIRLAPWEPLYRGLTGDFLAKRASVATSTDERVAILNDAVDYLKQMEPLQPGHPLWKMATGEGLGLLGQTGDVGSFYEADELFAEAREVAPYDWRVATRYGEMLNRWARTAKEPSKHCLALAQFKDAVALRKTDPRSFTGLATTYAFLGRLDEAQRPMQRAQRLDAKSRQVRSVARELEKLKDRDLRRIPCD